MALPAYAGEITSTITDSVQLSVEGPAVQTIRLGGTYSASGTNVSATLGGASSGAGTFTQTVDGQAFDFSESYNAADTPVTVQTSLSNNGRFDGPVLYGNSTTQIGGSAGTLAGTLSPTSVGTVTAGGPGTTGTLQRSVELSVF